MPQFAEISRTGVIMNGLFLICCSETVSLGVWSCHVELEVDCRLVGRWFEEL